MAQSKISCLKKFFLVEGKEIKNVYICSVKWHKKPQDGHIESVFAVLTKKSDSFKKQKDDRTTPISCIVMCQCCEMPIEDCNISREADGNFNEEYCQWCYADGEYTLDIWRRYAEMGGKEKPNRPKPTNRRNRVPFDHGTVHWDPQKPAPKG